MIYFFLNIFSNLLCIIFLVFYFRRRINIISFILILFNINTSFFFIFLNYNGIYELIVLLFSILLYNFLLFFDKEEQDIILIQNGNINFHEVIKNYSYQKLIKYLKRHHVRLDEIEYCILYNKHLTILKK